jgi:hypothetical protein
MQFTEFAVRGDKVHPKFILLIVDVWVGRKVHPDANNVHPGTG